MAQSTFNALSNDTDILSSSIISWALARVGSSLSVESGINQIKAGYNNPEWVIRRFFCRWDTSALTSLATITAVDLKIYVSAVVSTGGGALQIVSSTATDGVLQTSDWDNLGSTVFATIDISSLSVGAYNTFSLDANGIAQINKTGNTKLAFRISQDISNTDPNPNESNATIRVSGSASPQQLVITYTVPVVSSGASFIENFV